MAGTFDESKHHRAEDGKFGEGAGSAAPLRARVVSGVAAKANGAKAKRARLAAALAGNARAKKAATKERVVEPVQPKTAPAGRQSEPVANPLSGHGSGKERLESARAAAPRPDGDLVDAIGNGAIKNGNGKMIALAPESQTAVRQHFLRIAESHGLGVRVGDLEQGHVLASKSASDMGGASGLYHPNGKISVSEDVIGHLGYHAEDHAYDPDGARRGLEYDHYQNGGLAAYGVMVHETVHGTGPMIYYTGENAAKWQLAEELSTEMTARHITAAAHGIATHKMQGSGHGYDDVMQEAVSHVSKIAGVSHDAAFDAVAQSALAMKQRRGITIQPDEALSMMGADALRTLGALRPDAHFALNGKWQELAQEMNRRYPWP